MRRARGQDGYAGWLSLTGGRERDVRREGKVRHFSAARCSAAPQHTGFCADRGNEREKKEQVYGGWVELRRCFLRILA